MDFDNVLSIATQNQGPGGVPKRYSLKTGPPKKDVRVKGVNSAAVQAFLKKQAVEQKHKELRSKKAKEELLAKRVELKSDRKARAMASRTKDNFRGYNGVPVVEQPKKRQSRGGRTEDQETSAMYDEDSFDYEASDSESDEPSRSVEPSRPVKPQPRADSFSKVDSKQKKPCAPARPAPPPMNFAELLKLAQKKQFEPVELKPVKKIEERLRTADEIRELEMERKVKKQDRGKDVKLDRNSGQKDSTSHSSSSSQKKIADGDNRNVKLARSAEDKYSSSNTSKKPKPQSSSERTYVSAKPHIDRTNLGSSATINSKVAIKNSASFQAKQAPPRPSQGQRPTTSSDLTPKKEFTSGPQGKTNISGIRSGASTDAGRSGQGPQKNSVQVRLGQSNLDRGGHPQKQGKPGTMQRPGSGFPPRPGSNGLVRPSSGDSLKQQRPSGSLQRQQIPVGSRGSLNGPSKRGDGVSGRPTNSMGSGTGRPQCTVVSETISTKDYTPRPGMPQRAQGPRTVIGPTGHRILVTPSGPALPPITSSYKRKNEEEEEDEYDSEMDDFIDDEGEDQNVISKHIREIFGYDRSRFKDESDYALKFMESSWKEQQKEEARSLRLGIKEDEEDMRLEEEEEMKKKLAMKAKRKKI